MTGLTLYRREKLSRDNLLHRGLQLPKGEHSYRGSADKILYPEDIRKGAVLLPYQQSDTGRDNCIAFCAPDAG